MPEGSIIPNFNTPLWGIALSALSLGFAFTRKDGDPLKTPSILLATGIGGYSAYQLSQNKDRVFRARARAMRMRRYGY